MSEQIVKADIVIVGGGMVGATLACALGDSHLSVILLEAGSGEYTLPDKGYELRVSAITRASQRIFETLGVWPGIESRRISPYRDMHVWDASGSGVIHFDSADIGEATLGHIIENNVITAALYERLSSFENIEVIKNCHTESISISAENASLALKNGKTIKTSLIIGADGSRSSIRQQFDISVRGWDYDHTAVVTYVKTEKDHQETAWQRFLPSGPLAFLPLPDNYSSIVWSTRPDHAKELTSMTDDTFCSALSTAFEHTLGDVIECGPRAGFPLRFFVANEYVRPRLALVGDAAHTIHPLAGQGVNLGLADVASLAEVLMAADANVIGDMNVLRRYERWRKADSMSLFIAMDSLKRLFGTEHLAVKWIRNFGMSLTNRIGPVKNHLVRSAMGMNSNPVEGRLPRLSQGLPLVDRQ
ncbi:MAG: UbiH/UbiF/VisC/COQ6 family ubiquinone biosynthesis hydroxylase [Gammaproteobacteria bacterium]|nr:UbiH/UbiF/VisC/COQ6 family ubiquinone biosynthesis hydroxylase [Gammaproteobacteria bacterium]